MGIHYGKADFINYGKPSLLLDFARNKSLVDRITGNNLITFTRSSTGTYVGADGLIKTAAVNEPRFDHNPTTGESLGLLIEESRTNLFTNSGNLPNPDGGYSWSFENTHSAPDGGNTASKVTQLNTNASVLTKSFVFTGTILTYTIFTKAGSGFTTRPFGIYNITQSKDLYYVTFNYSTNTISGSSTFNGTTGYHSVTPYPNGWYRISITVTNNIASGNSLQVYLGDTGGPKTSTSPGSYFYVWGAQIEAGSFPTSYIPTSGSTVTRSVDNAQITGTNFSSWYNASESTILCDYSHIMSSYTAGQASGNERLYRFRAVGGNDTRIDYVTYNAYHPYIAADGFQIANLTGFTGLYDNQLNKTAVVVKQNDFAVASNGIIKDTDTSGTWPPSNTITEVNIGSQTGGNALNGHIKKFSYYPTRLTNTQLQQLTQ